MSFLATISKLSVIITLFCLSVLSAGAHAQTVEKITVIQAGWLLSHTNNKPMRQQTIIVKNKRISGVIDGYPTLKELGLSQSTTVVNLRDKYVLPGMIDNHVHLTGTLSTNAQLERTIKSDGDYAISAVINAQKTLYAGFTTVRDLGSPSNSIYSVRNAAAKQLIPGPRIIAAGAGISITGGHGDTSGYREDVVATLRSPAACDGADDCRRSVRKLVQLGSDVIKISATGGVMSNTASGVGQQLTDAELEAIVSTAHSLGRKVAAHAHDNQGIIAAINAGVDSIEHATFVDDKAIALLKRKGTFVVPTQMTIGVAEAIAHDNSGYPPAIRAKAGAILPKQKTFLAKLVKAGVNIAFGTDAAVFPHGNNTKEFLYLIKAGMTPTEAIATATINAATLLGLENEIGSIEHGKIADIIAVDSNPLDDITSLQQITFVMHDGQTHIAP